MKYIKRIILENFQSHKHSIIDLEERLNVIVGPSDSGKSAIIRGLKWALYNEPAGDYFIREGEKECSVSLEFSDNTILKRYRSKSKNSYILTRNNGEEIIFEGFGSAVPEEIIDIIGIKKIYLDSNEANSINLGEQLEGAFLLSEKTSTRASAIGRLVGVNLIDDALREVLKDTRGLNIDKRNLEENINKLDKEITQYDYLNDLKVKFNRISELNKEIKDKYDRIHKLNIVKERIKDVKEGLNSTSLILDKLKMVERLNYNIQSIDNRVLKYKHLNNYLSNLNKVKKDKYSYTIITNRLKGVEVASVKARQLEKNNYRYKNLVLLKAKKDSTLLENEKLNVALTKLSGLPSLENLIIEISDKVIRYEKLSDKVQKYNKAFNSINAGKLYIDKLSFLPNIENNYKDIDDKLRVLLKYTNLNKLLLTNYNDKESETNSLQGINTSLDIEVNNYQNLLREVEVCPFCLSDIDENKIEHIISHYIGG